MVPEECQHNATQVSESDIPLAYNNKQYLWTHALWNAYLHKCIYVTSSKLGSILPRGSSLLLIIGISFWATCSNSPSLTPSL